MLVVIDTNVLINAWRDDFSYDRMIIQTVIDGKIQAAATQSIWREYQLILDRLVNDQRHRDLINIFLNNITMATARSVSSVVKYDHEDEKFVACALSVKASYIITHDSHLLEVDSYNGIQIITPEKFWSVYKQQNDPEGLEQWQSWIKNIISS